MLFDQRVRHKPGTDVALLNGMMKVILDQGLEDKAFIHEKTEDFEAFKNLIEKVDLEAVSEITGVSTEDIETLALTYAEAGKASIVYCMGITQHTTGVDNVKDALNLVSKVQQNLSGVTQGIAKQSLVLGFNTIREFNRFSFKLKEMKNVYIDDVQIFENDFLIKTVVYPEEYDMIR